MFFFVMCNNHECIQVVQTLSYNTYHKIGIYIYIWVVHPLKDNTVVMSFITLKS